LEAEAIGVEAEVIDEIAASKSLHIRHRHKIEERPTMKKNKCFKPENMFLLL